MLFVFGYECHLIIKSVSVILVLRAA